ncbi:uncharacterized protein CANTADRAFT_107799 [Suhomyces tanzawaensis NRRL Y-17324]|uniref:Complex 1 LYR protein domain-containing protein n=1 Tax=Suhomyces tanzawaensis NRRL Y-17324 TaxID=984487 RepID=A0A1E4SPI6_9ASCO|nr:uncharacterized protein CANTADRAFT_107799 [Suhomyces tanzawaensis NRRL Y-17324]ODV81431.1 hypothetical protein CANTADRAFT_107799 [Suhomyces tanzawaensis NRRL Y-17324]
MTTQREVLSLYKQLLNKAYKFDNYNFREYAKRKITHSFKTNKSVTDGESITQLYNAGIDSLAQLHRQATISGMFTFDKLVVEPLKKHH